MSRWFRHYAGMMRDDKLVRAALKAQQPIERVVWIWGAILESAAEINDGGRYDIDPAEVAYFLRADEADIRAIFTALAGMQRLADDRVVNWSARQFQSDRSAPRQAAYRDRKRQESSKTDDRKTSGDEQVTAASRHGDAPETETEADTEKEKKERSLRSRSTDVSRETSDWPKDYREQFWNAYPRKKAKKSAFKALDRIRKSGEVAFDRLMAAILKIPIGEPVFIPHPATWLNQGRWDDEQLPGETLPRGPGPPVGNVIAAADRLVEKIRAFDEPAPDYHNLPPELDRSLRGGTGAPDVRLLPAR